jgi:hypothetical protein
MVPAAPFRRTFRDRFSRSFFGYVKPLSDLCSAVLGHEHGHSKT